MFMRFAQIYYFFFKIFSFNPLANKINVFEFSNDTFCNNARCDVTRPFCNNGKVRGIHDGSDLHPIVWNARRRARVQLILTSVVFIECRLKNNCVRWVTINGVKCVLIRQRKRTSRAAKGQIRKKNTVLVGWTDFKRTSSVAPCVLFHRLPHVGCTHAYFFKFFLSVELLLRGF